jgi:ATP-dependent DNA helicase
MKNHNCKLVRELQSYQSANRLLITGTPLQNNLSELWSLLNFLMPEIFDKLESFESWFDFSELKQKDGYEQIFTEERKRTLVASLHAILKPFLLRRVKADVEKNLPKKREYVLFAPLEAMQRDLYQAILDSNSRGYLEEKMFEQLSMSGTATPNSIRSINGGTKRKFLDINDFNTPNKSAKTSRATTPGSTGGRSTRSTRRKDYSEKSDSQYFAELENESAFGTDSDEGDEDEKIFASTIALVKREIGNKKLQNPVMQLRLCCNSPHIFYNPYLKPDGTMSDPDEQLVTSSGKMRILDALLPELFKDGHKVLIFSQFKSQLDILQDYAWLRGWPCCRIDGEVAQSDRAAQIEYFNTPSTAKDAANLFLLSTRAGGQGINLTAADTVILYDSDWNPQQDLQAQDRVHRIGQTRNVIIYRLATRGTVEQGLLEKAEGKRRLEKLVIQKGGVKDIGRKETLEELKDLLSRTDGEQWEVNEGEVLTKKDLKILTDRSEEAYVRAEKGQDEGLAFKAIDNRVSGGLLEKLQG